MNTRRQFLISAPLGLLVAAASHAAARLRQSMRQSAPATAGAPPTFGTGPVPVPR